MVRNSEKMDMVERLLNDTQDESISKSYILLKDTRMNCIKRYNQVESLEKVSKYNEETTKIRSQSLENSNLSDVKLSQNMAKIEQKDGNGIGKIDIGHEETDREGRFASFNPDISEIKKKANYPPRGKQPRIRYNKREQKQFEGLSCLFKN